MKTDLFKNVDNNAVIVVRGRTLIKVSYSHAKDSTSRVKFVSPNENVRVITTLEVIAA